MRDSWVVLRSHPRGRCGECILSACHQFSTGTRKIIPSWDSFPSHLAGSYMLDGEKFTCFSKRANESPGSRHQKIQFTLVDCPTDN